MIEDSMGGKEIMAPPIFKLPEYLLLPEMFIDDRGYLDFNESFDHQLFLMRILTKNKTCVIMRGIHQKQLREGI